MSAQEAGPVRWHRAEVKSPHLARPVSVVAAKDIPYLPDADRLQTLSLYLPDTSETSALVGTAADSLPKRHGRSLSPSYQVHIHGGAWRDPQLTSASIEPTVANAFSAIDAPTPISAATITTMKRTEIVLHERYENSLIRRRSPAGASRCMSRVLTASGQRLWGDNVILRV